ncbi:hypothetical protein [Halonotius sp. GCM10025705]|uniref:hypothetical protein n=1 Tax=Halonotius sp. GCM10025705 TaxID=3252678 RepID=UPI003609D8E4
MVRTDDAGRVAVIIEKLADLRSPLVTTRSYVLLKFHTYVLVRLSPEGEYQLSEVVDRGRGVVGASGCEAGIVRLGEYMNMNTLQTWYRYSS